MNRALLVLFAVASLAGCSESTGPSAMDKLSVTASKADQVLTIRNDSNERLHYWYFVDDGLTDWTTCGGNPCGSIAAKSSVMIRYADIKSVPGAPRVLTFVYWRMPEAPWARFDSEDRTLTVPLQ